MLFVTVTRNAICSSSTEKEKGDLLFVTITWNAICSSSTEKERGYLLFVTIANLICCLQHLLGKLSISELVICNALMLIEQ